MFDTARQWRKAGFEVSGKGAPSDIMVGSHLSAPGYLFKKYSKKVSLKDQLENYRRRAESAQKLGEFIAAQRLSQIVVPRKYLHELPPEFSRKGVSAFVLVVERLGLLDNRTSKQRYQAISDETLRQICAVLFAFRGLDSGARNMPFTDRGQIAFVDTERWAGEKRKVPLRHLREYLTAAKRRVVDALVEADARRGG
jgi:hypothetical protein